MVVGRIVRGGVAERSGLLHEGDEILEVNGIEVRGKSINDVCDLVASMTGTITFLIVPAASSSPSNTTVVKPALTPNQPNVVSCLGTTFRPWAIYAPITSKCFVQTKCRGRKTGSVNNLLCFDWRRCI